MYPVLHFKTAPFLKLFVILPSAQNKPLTGFILPSCWLLVAHVITFFYSFSVCCSINHRQATYTIYIWYVPFYYQYQLLYYIAPSSSCSAVLVPNPPYCSTQTETHRVSVLFILTLIEFLWSLNQHLIPNSSHKPATRNVQDREQEAVGRL